MPTVTDAQLHELRTALMMEGGQDELVEVCNIALGEIPAPFGPGLETVEKCRAECAREIDYRAQVARGDLVDLGLCTQSGRNVLDNAFAEAMVDEAYWRSR